MCPSSAALGAPYRSYPPQGRDSPARKFYIHDRTLVDTDRAEFQEPHLRISPGWYILEQPFCSGVGDVAPCFLDVTSITIRDRAPALSLCFRSGKNPSEPLDDIILGLASSHPRDLIHLPFTPPHCTQLLESIFTNGRLLVLLFLRVSGVSF